MNVTREATTAETTTIALLDANVFVSVWTIDLLLTLSEEGLFAVA